MTITLPLPPSLPILRQMPGYIGIDALTGYVCSHACQVNPYLTTAIFAIRPLAQTLFYHIANSFFEKKDLGSQKIYLFTSTSVNLIFIIVLRELDLIGYLFSCVIAAATVGYLIKRAIYVQSEERRMINDENANRRVLLLDQIRAHSRERELIR